MNSYEKRLKEKLDVSYDLHGISADANQLARANLRNEPKGVRKNISQMITKLEKIRKRI